MKKAFILLLSCLFFSGCKQSIKNLQSAPSVSPEIAQTDNTLYFEDEEDGDCFLLNPTLNQNVKTYPTLEECTKDLASKYPYENEVWEKYSNPELGLSFEIPKGAVVKKSENPHQTIWTIDRGTIHKYKFFSVSIRKYPVKSGKDLQQQIRELEQGIQLDGSYGSYIKENKILDFNDGRHKGFTYEMGIENINKVVVYQEGPVVYFFTLYSGDAGNSYMDFPNLDRMFLHMVSTTQPLNS